MSSAGSSRDLPVCSEAACQVVHWLPWVLGALIEGSVKVVAELVVGGRGFGRCDWVVGEGGGRAPWSAGRVGAVWVDASPLCSPRVGTALRRCAGSCPSL